MVGSGLVLGFMVWRAGGIYLGAANIYLLIAMTTGALGYIGGARLTPRLGAEQVICWVLVCSLPLTLPVLRQAGARHLLIQGAAKRVALEGAQGRDPMQAPIAALLDDIIVHWAE